MCACLSRTPIWWPGPLPRHVPWQGIEPATPLVWRLTLYPLSHTSQGMDLGYSCRPHHLSEDADFSGNDVTLKDFGKLLWSTSLHWKGSVPIYVYILSILTCLLSVRQNAGCFTDVILLIPHISHERELQTHSHFAKRKQFRLNYLTEFIHIQLTGDRTRVWTQYPWSD